MTSSFYNEYTSIINAYCLGDRIGSFFEGYSKGFDYDMALKLMAVDGGCLAGTDESDIVNTFGLFGMSYGVNGLIYEDLREAALKWFVFHAEHRKSVRYGKSYKRHFALVRLLNSTGSLDYDRMMELSKDQNSFGNGALALALPLYILWERSMRGYHPTAFVSTFVRPVHFHRDVEKAFSILWDFFVRGSYEQLFKLMNERDMFWVSAERTPHVLGCLATAAYCAHEAVEPRDILRNASLIGGDVDSYLSLAFLIHQYRVERIYEKHKTGWKSNVYKGVNA